MKVLVTGARGQLGAAVVREFGRGHEVAAFGHAELDVTDFRQITSEVARVRPAVIVNCAGYNNVDGAEDHPLDALGLNAVAVRSLARAAAESGAALVHYSSDFVFDGEASAPYREEDRPNPKSVYAASKLLGEWFARDAPRHYVLRVESLFGEVAGLTTPKGTVEGIRRALAENREARVFVDRTVSPTFVFDAAVATRALVEGSAPPGVYHCVNIWAALVDRQVHPALGGGLRATGRRDHFALRRQRDQVFRLHVAFADMGGRHQDFALVQADRDVAIAGGDEEMLVQAVAYLADFAPDIPFIAFGIEAHG